MNAQTQTNGNALMVQGRIIWGLGQSLFEGQMKKDQQTKQIIVDPKTGQGTVEYGFGLAVPKLDLTTNQFTQQWVQLYQAMMAEAMTMFPSGQVPPTFAMKYKDGDTAVDEQGRPYSAREGYANHIVVSCTTQLPIKWFKWDGQQNVMINEGVKVGDYVNVQLNIKAHPAVGRGKAGLYMNPSAVQLIASGKAIVNAPSGDQMFGMQAPQYQGQIEAATVGQMPNLGNAQAPSMMPPMQAPMAPQQNFQAPPQQQVQPQYDPNYNVIPQHHQPQQAPMAPQQPMQQAAPGMMPPMPPR